MLKKRLLPISFYGPFYDLNHPFLCSLYNKIKIHLILYFYCYHFNIKSSYFLFRKSNVRSLIGIKKIFLCEQNIFLHLDLIFFLVKTCIVSSTKSINFLYATIFQIWKVHRCTFVLWGTVVLKMSRKCTECGSTDIEVDTSRAGRVIY